MQSLSKDPDPLAFLGVLNSANGRKWSRKETDPRAVEAMVQREGIHPILAEVLSARGVGLHDVGSFLAPTLKGSLVDPSAMMDMDKAASRIADAVMGGEVIGIFGDYDVDGTTSAALLSRYCSALEVAHHVHLPDRQAEGYGPNLPAFEGLVESGASLILSVDCGATAHDVLGEAAQRGWETIVLDHHMMDLPAPKAVAIVNPNRPDDVSGLTNLSAGGVVFMTLVAVNRTLRQRGFFEERKEPNLLAWLDLVALSLVCDVMSLTGLTRVLVRQGLKVLGDFDTAVAGNLGIRALAQTAGAKGLAQASHFGFQVGPRINAAGRIGNAKIAFDLLTTDDPERAETLAERLQDLNGMRQGVEKAVLDEATAQAEGKGGRDVAAPLVVMSDGWHPGVIGIVAGRLKEKYNRPAIVIAFDGDEGKGSGRSLTGVDLGEAISKAVAAGVIAGGGGHSMAAGLSLTRSQLGAFETFLADTITLPTQEARQHQALWLDGLIGLGSITRTFCEELAAAGPFGNGNPEPRFAVEHVRLTHLKILKERHVACTLQDKMGRTVRAICFGCVGDPLGDLLTDAADGRPLHLAGRVKPDDWRGGDCAQFHIEDGALCENLAS
ncbi:MAG: single-stranded-DNA-specific exonuclease RecJ [Pseudomonadota bacterium]